MFHFTVKPEIVTVGGITTDQSEGLTNSKGYTWSITQIWDSIPAQKHIYIIII